MPSRPTASVADIDEGSPFAEGSPNGATSTGSGASGLSGGSAEGWDRLSQEDKGE